MQTAKCLLFAKPPQLNLSKIDRIALSSLDANKDMVILPADKGITILLNKSQYFPKIYYLLQGGIYILLTRIKSFQ